MWADRLRLTSLTEEIFQVLPTGVVRELYREVNTSDVQNANCWKVGRVQTLEI